MELRRFLEYRTIDDLHRVVENYMKHEVDGDKFRDEQAFEDAVRAILKKSGFEVLEKHNVEHTRELVEEKLFSGVDGQIPDISIQCRDGLVFLELKFKNTPQKYKEDIEKVANFLRAGKCDAAGVLFLDDTHYPGWEQCKKNPKYYYLWRLDRRAKQKL